VPRVSVHRAIVLCCASSHALTNCLQVVLWPVQRAVVGGSGATKLSAVSGPSLAQAAEEAVYWEEPSLFHHHHNDATAAPGPNSASDCYCGISRGVTGTGVVVTESRLKENCAAVVAIHEVAFGSM
jgi:hypothetical protein